MDLCRKVSVRNMRNINRECEKYEGVIADLVKAHCSVIFAGKKEEALWVR